MVDVARSNRAGPIKTGVGMKMYILIKDSTPPSYAIVAAAHASLGCYLKYQDDPDVKEWVSGPFNKMICSVNEKEFENAKTTEGHVVITESQLDGAEIALVFKPREEWPKMFKFFRKYK